MKKRLTILVFLLVSLVIPSCKTKNEVVIPDRDNAKTWEESEKQTTYEQAVKMHWAMQTKEVKRSAKDNKKRSAKFNSPKKHKRKAKACNNCVDNESVVMDGVRDFK